MDFAFGRRFFADGTFDRHGLPRLRPKPSKNENAGDDGNIGDDEHIGDGDTRVRNIATEPGHRRGAMKAPESDLEHFDLEAVGSDEFESESGGEELLRRTNFRRKLVKICTSPVRPAPKSKPSYMDLTDSQPEASQVSDNEDWDVDLPRQTSKSKGKAVALGKRKVSSESLASRHVQKAEVCTNATLMIFQLSSDAP